MIRNLSKEPSLILTYLNQLREVNIQKDPFRFRLNIERISQIMAYEVSKMLSYSPIEIQTPLGVHLSKHLDNQIVISSILRAALPMHYGLLQYLELSENAFIGAFRKYHKSGTFEISIDYITAPSLQDKTLILCDPMIATGDTIIATLEQLKHYGTPIRIIVLGIIASQQGIMNVRDSIPNVEIIIGEIDEELTAKSFIVPGLGDAGDLAFGPKL